MLKKEVECMVQLGFLEIKNGSELVSLYFDHPKVAKNGVRVLSDFRNINGQLKYNPYPMSKAI